MFGKWKGFLPGVLIFLLTGLLFRSYFTKHLVPFPANLLVSYYEPWKSYPVPEYPHGPPNKAMGFDTVRIYYPVKTVAMNALRHFEPPLWNPYAAAGTLLHATYQSALFHPLAWLFFIIPQIDAWSVIVMLQPIIAFAAMYILLSVFGLSRTARTIGSLAYATCGFFMVWWQESYMFTYSSMSLPIALALIELFIRKPKLLHLGLLSITLALSIYAGAFQMTFYTYLFSIAFLIYRIWNEPKKMTLLFSVGGSMALSLFLGGIQLLPNIEAYTQSARATADIKYIFSSQLLPLSQLVTFIAPDYFGNPATYNYFGKGFYHERLYWIGAIPFLLLLTQVFKRKWTERHGRFFQIAFWVTLSLSLALPTSWLVLYYLKLPLLSTMTPSRIIMLISFSGCVLAAFGAEDYLKGFQRRTLIQLTLMIGILGGLISISPFVARYVDPKNTSYMISLRNLVIPGLSFLAGLTVFWIVSFVPRWKRYGSILLIALLFGNAIVFAQKYLYFSERRFVFPSEPVITELQKRSEFSRFWTYDNGYIDNNFASFYGLFSAEGYDSIMIRRYAEFLAFANSEGKSTNPDRANALIQSTDHLNDILKNPYRKKTLQLLGVFHILQRLVPDRNEQKMLPDPKDLPTIWNDGTFAIHEFGDTLPRAKLYQDVRVERDGNTLLQKLFNPKTDVKKTVFLEEPVTLQKSIIPLVGAARITKYTANTVTVRYVSTAPSLLFLSDVWAPGWSALLDGKETKLYRADYTFRAVVAPAGIHVVEFRYEPESWKLGLLVSGIGAILLIFVFIANRLIPPTNLSRPIR